MLATVVGILALAQLSAATSVDYKFSHDPISLGSGRKSADEYLAQVANEQLSENLDHRQLNTLSQNVDVTGTYGAYSSIFEKMTFPQEQYTRFQGLDDTALYATSVSVSNDYAIVGSNGYNIYMGIVHVYTPINESAWAVHSTILSPDGPNINFGLSVDHTSKFLIVGANALDVYKGAAYIYQLFNNKYWILTTRIYSPFGATQGFGFKVAIDGNTAVVATAINDVSVYQFDTATESWVNTKRFSGLASDDRFGNSIDIFGEYLVIGAPQALNGRGAVYVYKQFNNTDWTLSSVLENPGNQWQYGYSVSLFNTTLAVGAVGYREGTFRPIGSDSLDNTGYAYIYEYSSVMDSYETLVQSIPSPVGYKSYFGVYLSLAKDKLIVGADGAPSGNNTGAAFIYFRTPDRPREDMNPWQLNYSLPSPAGSEGRFGYAVDVCDNYAVSGAFGYDDLRGSVYLIGFPRPQPTMAPTLAPTAGGNDAQSLNTITSAVAKQEKMMEILGIGVLTLVGVLTSACCIYLCCVPVAGKKKKEEEEESPYTVHSYVGYSEMDEYMPPQAPPPQWMPFFAQMPPMMPMMMAPPPMPMPMMPMDMDMKKKMMGEGEELDLKKVDENFVRKLFPYKVYGPRGYQEEGQTANDAEEAERAKREFDKNQSMSSSVDDETNSYNSASTASKEERFTSDTSQDTMYRKQNPYSMETIREAEREDGSSSSSASSVQSEQQRLAAKHAQFQQPPQRSLPYTYSSQYNMQGIQQYDMQNQQNNTSFFSQPSMASRGDDVSSLSSQPSSNNNNLYGAATHNPHMFAPYQHMQAYPPQAYYPPQQPYPANMNMMMPTPPPVMPHEQANASSTANYVAMAKQGYAKFKQGMPATQAGVDDAASVSTAGHSARVRNYASERSASDLMSTTSHSDDSFVQKAKQRYMQFLVKKNMTKEEHEADELMREQSHAFLKPSHPQDDEDDDEEGDDHTVSTMTGTVRSNMTSSTGFYSESSAGSRFSQRSSNSMGGGALALGNNNDNNVARPAPAVVAEVPAPAVPVRNTLFKAAAVERNTVPLGAAPQLKLSKKIEFEELDEIKEIAVPVANTRTTLLNSRPVATISGIEERALKEVNPMATLRANTAANASVTASSSANNLAMSLEQEVEEARQKTVEELERARAMAQTLAAEEELKRIQDRNRIKEETRLRAEERARAQFALHKQRTEQMQQQQQQQRGTVVASSAVNETLLAAERALASVQQISTSTNEQQQQLQQVNVSTRITTQTTTTTNVRTTTNTINNNVVSTKTTQPRIEEP